MSGKLLLVILSGLTEILCIFTLIQAELRKRPQGEKLLGVVEAGAAKLVNWRADADVMGEARWMKRLCGWGLGLSCALVFLCAVFNLRLITLLVVILFVISFFGYASLEWVLNWRSIFKFYGVLFLVSLGSIIFAYYLRMPEYQRLRLLTSQFMRLVGVAGPTPSVTLTLMVSAGVFVGLFTLMTVIAVAVSAGIFTPLWLTSRLSDLLRKRFNWDVLWWFAVAMQFALVILNGVIDMM